MIAVVSPLRSCSRNDGGGGIGQDQEMAAAFSIGDDVDFPDFSCAGNLLDSIDFDDLFVGIHDGGCGGEVELLPDLEMDPDLFAEFSVSSAGGSGSSEDHDHSSTEEDLNAPSSDQSADDYKVESSMGHQLFPVTNGSGTTDYNGNNVINDNSDYIRDNKRDRDRARARARARARREKKVRSAEAITGGDEMEMSSDKTEAESAVAALAGADTGIGAGSQQISRDRRKKWSSAHHNHHQVNNSVSRNGGSNNNNQATKRKAKVDWTPELHRRFVQAVEQLGVDKAVPSRILEIMGIDCLTRHNVASHLQKYRSHRKHVQTREAETATWSQKRQMYNVAVGGSNKISMHHPNPWHAPIMGFPPPVRPLHPGFRPLHVWGHPPMEMWPKHLVPSPSLAPPQQAWTPPPHHHPPADISFWHTHHQGVPHALAPPTPCFSQPLPPARFSSPPVPGIPPHAMHIPVHGIGRPPSSSSEVGHSPPDFHPTKESIDAAIGDVLAKRWLPLPIGLKPPSVDSVLRELQRQGVPKIPPPTTTCA